MTDVDIEFDMDEGLEVIAEIDVTPVGREPFEALYPRMFDTTVTILGG